MPLTAEEELRELREENKRLLTKLSTIKIYLTLALVSAVLMLCLSCLLFTTIGGIAPANAQAMLQLLV